jgi:hypothetical protein
MRRPPARRITQAAPAASATEFARASFDATAAGVHVGRGESVVQLVAPAANVGNCKRASSSSAERSCFFIESTSDVGLLHTIAAV